ncbi:MAG: hypothetical protein HOO67_00485 [Candidatus Peribacteraceae bacterium]|nr:hypothetical protein [Candidatus Peribacteraceae bacterium]
MKKNNSLYLSLVSGAVGIMIGAGSMYVGQAGLIHRGVTVTTHSSASRDREASTREIKQQGLNNQAERKGTNPDAAHTTGTAF